jgi:hypothetical protein
MAQSIGWHMTVGTTVTIVPATCAVAARFYARHFSQAGLRGDDWTIFAALVRHGRVLVLGWSTLCQSRDNPVRHKPPQEACWRIGSKAVARCGDFWLHGLC